jgi:hypothetical protein
LRIANAAFGFALAFGSPLAFAGGSDNVDGRCGAHVEDFSKFQICFGYPAAAPPGINCTLFDFDTNGIVNLADFAARTFVLRDRISVFPARVVISYSQQVDFDAVIAGSGNQSVQWVVMPVPGSEPGESLGTINANGLYSPPSPLNLHAASEVVVLATSQGGGGPGPASDFACVSLLGTVAARPPINLVLPGLGDSGGIQSNITTAMPLVVLALPGLGDPGESPANVTVAGPPTALVLPGEGDLDELAMNVTLAMPPVALVLPGIGEPDVFPSNTTVANPPVAVEFEDAP